MLIPHPHAAFVRDFPADLHQAREFFRSVWQPPVEPPLALQVFLDARRGAGSGDPSRTRRLLELAARLLGERNSARIVHAVLSYLYHVTPLDPDTVRALFPQPRLALEDAMRTAAQQPYERGRRKNRLSRREPDPIELQGPVSELKT